MGLSAQLSVAEGFGTQLAARCLGQLTAATEEFRALRGKDRGPGVSMFGKIRTGMSKSSVAAATELAHACLAAGCVFRHVGPMELQASIGSTVTALVEAGTAPEGSPWQRLWALHGLW